MWKHKDFYTTLHAVEWRAEKKTLRERWANSCLITMNTIAMNMIMMHQSAHF